MTYKKIIGKLNRAIDGKIKINKFTFDIEIYDEYPINFYRKEDEYVFWGQIDGKPFMPERSNVNFRGKNELEFEIVISDVESLCVELDKLIGPIFENRMKMWTGDFRKVPFNRSGEFISEDDCFIVDGVLYYLEIKSSDKQYITYEKFQLINDNYTFILFAKNEQELIDKLIIEIKRKEHT
jgi:hypothetical protein